MSTYSEIAHRIINNNGHFNQEVVYYDEHTREKTFVIFPEQDVSIPTVYSLKVIFNDGTIGKIYNIYGENELATALNQLDNGTAIVSTRKGRKTINEILHKSNTVKFNKIPGYTSKI